MLRVLSRIQRSSFPGPGSLGGAELGPEAAQAEAESAWKCSLSPAHAGSGRAGRGGAGGGGVCVLRLHQAMRATGCGAGQEGSQSAATRLSIQWSPTG